MCCTVSWIRTHETKTSCFWDLGSSKVSVAQQHSLNQNPPEDMKWESSFWGSCFRRRRNVNCSRWVFFVTSVSMLSASFRTNGVPACTLLVRHNKTVKVVVAVWAEQDVQDVPGAFNWRRQLVAAEPTNHRGGQTVAVTHLHVVVTAAVVGLQTEQRKPAVERLWS